VHALLKQSHQAPTRCKNLPSILLNANLNWIVIWTMLSIWKMADQEKNTLSPYKTKGLELAEQVIICK